MSPGRSWAVWVLVASLPLLGFWTYGLFDLDEGFYAAVVRDMIRRGDWVVPTIGGEPWFEKPILLYWTSIPFVRLFGAEVGPRFAPVLATVATIGLAGWAVARFSSARVAPLACLAVGTSLLVAASGRMMLTDGLLVLTLSGAMLAYFGSLSAERPTPFLVASGVALGLSVLAKGPVGCAFFTVVVALTAWRERQVGLDRPRSAIWVGWGGFLLAFAAVVASWYVPAYLREGDVFVEKFLIEQNVGRFAGGDKAHQVTEPWLHIVYFPAILLLGMAPWSFQGFRRSFWLAHGEEGAFQRFLVRWLLVILAFFTLSGSKLPHYILPATVPFAMLAALSFGQGRRDLARLQLAGAIGAMTLMLGLTWGFQVYYRSSGHAEVHGLASLASQTDSRPTLWMYQMPRRTKALGTGTLKVQETSHPSVRFYYEGPVDEGEDLVRAAADDWILTRTNRQVPDRVADRAVETVRRGDSYVLLRVAR